MPEERHTTSIDIKVDDRQVVALGEEMERTFSSKIIESFNKGLERQAKALDELTKQQRKFGEERERWARKEDRKLSRGQGSDIDRRLGGGGKGGRPPGGGGISDVAIGTVIGNVIVSQLGRMRQAATGAITGQNVAATMAAGAAPIGGDVIAAAAQGAQQFYGEYAGREIAQAGAFSGTGMSKRQLRGAVGTGRGAGLGAEEALGQLPGYAQQTGLKGDALTPLVEPLQRLGNIMGVSQAGGLIGAAGTGFGKDEGPDTERSKKLLQDAVGTGLAIGLRETRLDQFITGVSQFTEQARSKGIKLEPEAILQFARATGEATGLKAEALQSFVLQGLPAFQQAGQGASLFDMLAIQGGGKEGGPQFGEAGGPNYFERIKDIQKNPMQAATQFASAFQEGGLLDIGSVEARAHFMMLELQKKGINLGAEALEGVVRGGPIEEALGADPRANAEDRMGKLEGRSEAVFATKKIEENYKQRRIGVGAAVAGEGKDGISPIQQMRNLDLRISKETIPRAARLLGQVAGVIDAALDALELLIGTSAQQEAEAGAEVSSKLDEAAFEENRKAKAAKKAATESGEANTEWMRENMPGFAGKEEASKGDNGVLTLKPLPPGQKFGGKGGVAVPQTFAEEAASAARNADALAGNIRGMAVADQQRAEAKEKDVD